MSGFHIVIRKAGGNFSAHSHDLPGCVATGRTRAEAGRRMEAAMRMHLEGLRDEGAKALKCGKCRTAMKGRHERRLGLDIIIKECPHCGKRLMSMDDAIRLQERALLEIRKAGFALKNGSLKCICGKTARRVNGLEHKGASFRGQRCKCGETLIDPYEANMYLKKRKRDGCAKTASASDDSNERKRAVRRMNEIQKTMGAAARRKRITKKGLMDALGRVRKPRRAG